MKQLKEAEDLVVAEARAVDLGLDERRSRRPSTGRRPGCGSAVNQA
jgi:hypothetical protein